MSTLQAFRSQAAGSSGSPFLTSTTGHREKVGIVSVQEPQVLSLGPSCPTPSSFTQPQLFLEGIRLISTSGPLHLLLCLACFPPRTSPWLRLLPPSAFAQGHLLQRSFLDTLVERTTLIPPHQLSVPLVLPKRCCHCPTHTLGLIPGGGSYMRLGNCGLKDNLKELKCRVPRAGRLA